MAKVVKEEMHDEWQREFKKECSDWKGRHKHWHHSHNGAVYGLGVIGALIFFLGKAATFWAGVLGIFQALVWPAFLVYEALRVLVK